MNKPHKWADVIHAWADGKAVQCKYTGFKAPQWRDATVLDGIDSPVLEWRIKPEPVKAKYRVALMGPFQRQTFYIANDSLSESLLEESVAFVRWMTDWIEVEV